MTRPLRQDDVDSWTDGARHLRVMLHTRWSADASPEVKAEFKKALALRSQIRRARWFN
jgi:hypothetical protein